MAIDNENILTLPEVGLKAEPGAEAALRGSVLVLIQFDVCEEIRLDQLRHAHLSNPASSIPLRDTFGTSGRR